MKKLAVPFFLTLALLTAPSVGLAEESSSDSTKTETTFSAALREEINKKQQAKEQANLGQWRSESPSLEGSGLKMFTGLVSCLGVFLVGAYLYRRFAPKALRISSRAVRVVEKTQISSKTTLYLVEVEGRKVLLAAGGEKITFYQPAETEAESAPEFELICDDELKLSA